MPTGRMILCLATVAVALLPSCGSDNNGDTQGPEPPPTYTLDSPVKPFIYMTDAVKTQKAGGYAASLSDSFLFSPTLADSLDASFTGTTVFDDWGKDVELKALNLLFVDASKTTLDFGTPLAVINKSTFVRYRTTYSLDVITESPVDTLAYKGVAFIDVRNENGSWRMTSWNEAEEVPGFRTWGYLRGTLRLRF